MGGVGPIAGSDCLPTYLPIYLPVSMSDLIRERGWLDRRLLLPACLPTYLCQCLIQFRGGVGPIKGSHCLPYSSTSLSKEDVRKERWVKNKVGYIGVYLAEVCVKAMAMFMTSFPIASTAICI